MILSSKFPMFLWWGEDMIQFYNDAYRPSMGERGKHPRALGQKGKECWPEIWPIISPLIKKVQATGEACWNEDMLVPIYRNGSLEDVYWTFGYSAIRGENGKVEGVLVVCHETTQKVRMLDKLASSSRILEDSERNLRNTIIQAPVAMCILKGEKHVVELANARMYELWGRPASELQGKPIFEGLPEAGEQGFEELLAGVYTTGEPYSALATPVRLPRNGATEIIYINLLYEAYRDQGVITGIIAVAVDVTSDVIAKHRIEEVVEARTRELAEANHKLRQSNSELQEFAHVASHDLQEPLRKIGTFVQLLENSLHNPSEKSRHFLDKIKNSSTRMSKLIRDVLTYSKLSDHREVYKQCDLNAVMLEIIADFEHLIEQKKAIISYPVLPVIDAIPLYMTQLFGNLLSNSLKYSREDLAPEITLTCTILPEKEKQFDWFEKDRIYYKFEFSDNGIGFDQIYAERIFSIFQRLHTKSEYAGTGIGLALCKKIALKHHGDIFASGGDNGAVFTIFLPETQSQL